MTFDTFASISGFDKTNEVGKIALFGFYLSQVKGQEYFTIKEFVECLGKYGHPAPNISRLKKNMTDSKKFVKGEEKNTFRLRKTAFDLMKDAIPEVSSKSEEVVTDETILPEILYKKTRGYIEKLAVQINGAYHYNIFDGCAMLMRRLLEVLLLEVYDHLGRRSEIEENGNLKNLSNIIGHTLVNKVVNFHKDSIAVLDSYRELGNLSAHRARYNATRVDISNVKLQYRAVVEELLYASGLKK